MNEFTKYGDCPYSISNQCIETIDCWHDVKDERTGKVTEMRMSEIMALLKNYGLDNPQIHARIDERMKNEYETIRKENAEIDLEKDTERYKNGEISKRELIRRRLYINNQKNIFNK